MAKSRQQIAQELRQALVKTTGMATHAAAFTRRKAMERAIAELDGGDEHTADVGVPHERDPHK